MPTAAGLLLPDIDGRRADAPLSHAYVLARFAPLLLVRPSRRSRQHGLRCPAGQQGLDGTGRDHLPGPGAAHVGRDRVLHSETNRGLTDLDGSTMRPRGEVHVVRMLVVPDESGIAPGYDQLDINAELDRGGLIPVASGRDDDAARLTLAGGTPVVAGPDGAEILVWELHARVAA